jgi:hypothetical protein
MRKAADIMFAFLFQILIFHVRLFNNLLNIVTDIL